MSEPQFKVSTPPKTQIAKAFGLKAHSYDTNAVIQKELISRLDFELINNSSEQIWADLGSGTGILEQILRTKGFHTRLLGIDIAFESLRVLKSRKLQNTFSLLADIENPPFKHNILDGAIIASVLQWFNDPYSVLNSIAHVLKNNGILLFTTFIKSSFRELNTIKKELNLKVPVLLPDEKQLCSSLEKAGFSILKTNTFTSTIYFPTAFKLLKSLSAIGGTAVTGDRLSRNALFNLCEKFELNFRSDNGVPLTYKALIGSARKG